MPRHHDRIGALLLLGLSTGSLIVGVPSAARAQLRGVDTRLELGGRRLAVSPPEMRALLELGSLVHSGNRSRQDLALAVARSAARTGDSSFALATYELEIGKMREDDQMRVRALATLTASDLLPPDRLASHLYLLGQLSFASGDLAGARGAWERILRRSPDRHETLAALAQVDLKEAKWHPAIDKLNRASDLAAGSGTKAPESWYRHRLSAAQQGRLVTEGLAAARALVTIYPTRPNRRAALIVTRDLAAYSGPAEVDLLRLMLHAGVLHQSAEYLRLAQLLRASGDAAAAHEALREGISASLIDVQRSPAREIMAEVRRTLATPSAPASSATGACNAAVGMRLAIENLAAGRRNEALRLFKQAATVPAQH